MSSLYLSKKSVSESCAESNGDGEYKAQILKSGHLNRKKFLGKLETKISYIRRRWCVKSI